MSLFSVRFNSVADQGRMEDASYPVAGKSDAVLSACSLDRLLFSAKIDYITIHTPGKCKLPALSGTAIWPRKHHGKLLTVHDASASDIQALIAVVGPARIKELEIAVDLRPANPVPSDERESLLRSVMVNIFARQLEPSGGEGMSEDFRAFYRRLEDGYLVRPFNHGLPWATDQQLHGGRHAPVQVKGYWKRRDQRRPLPPEKQVARVEVRLGSEGLFTHNLVTLADLKDFRFRKKLLPYFRHVQGTRRLVRRADRPNMEMRKLLAARQHEIDQVHWQRVGAGAFTRGGKREGERVSFVRNKPVNNRIGQALTRLEQQFQKTKFVRSDAGSLSGEPSLARLVVSPEGCRMTNQVSHQ